MKRTLTVLLALVLLLGSFNAALAEEPVNITVFHYMLQATKQQGLDAIEAAYTEQHPNVTFTNIFYNQGTDYFPQLSTALASGEAPEIIMGNPGLYPDLVTEGFVMPLTDNEAIKALSLPSGDLGDVSSGGVLYGFPIDFKSWGIFYNTEIFAAQGIEVPRTQAELIAVCEKLKEAGVDPFVRAFGDAVMGDIEMRNTVWTRATEAGDFDLFESLMNGSKKFADYPYFAEGLAVWQERMAWPRSDDMSNSQDKSLEVFAAGGAAMLYTGTWSVGDLVAKQPAFEFGFFLAPIDDTPDSAKLNVQVDQAFMVNPKADHVDIALDFMEFWLAEGLAWSETAQMPLSSGKTSDNLLPMVRTLAEMKATGNIAHYGDFTMPFSSAFTTAWRKELTAFAESCLTGGTMTIDQCIENLQAAFDEIIELNK